MEHIRLLISILLLFAVIALGTLGYFYFENMEIFDSFYMTLITISNLGFGVIVIAIKQASGEMIFNPNADQVLSSGDVIVVIGKKPDLARMSKILT